MSNYSSTLTAILDREPEPAGSISTHELDYEVDGVACTGFLATPFNTSGALPGVLVVPDWLGVGDYTKMRAEMLARLGYSAFVADIYGNDLQATVTPENAADAAGGFYGNKELWRTRVQGAFDTMVEQPEVDNAKTAAIGYCFGGSSVLELARIGAPVDAVVSFHGGLPAGAEGEADNIKAKLLVLTGANDPIVPDDAVVAFENEMRTNADLDWQVTTYAGAMHAFTLPDANMPEHGAMYNANAERRSWAAMKGFLTETLG